MRIWEFTLLALGGSFHALGVTAVAVEKRQDVTHKFCPGGTNICFSETQINDITFRIAIPDVSAAPFDILLQIVAPISSTGWAGVAWGGKMANNPLTVGWPNGNGVTVSSRWATGHVFPQAYAGATYSILPSAHTNDTHWHLDVLAVGVSQWGTTSLNPNGVNTLAWAKSSRAVTAAASNASTFGYHDGRGTFVHDFSAAKIPQGVFDALVYDLNNPNGASSAATSKSQNPSGSVSSIAAPPPSSPAVGSTSRAAAPSVTSKTSSAVAPPPPPPSVVTGVTTVPRSGRPTTTTPPPAPPASFTVPAGQDQPISTRITITIAPSPTPPPPAVTIWISESDDGDSVTWTQPGNGGGGVVTVTVTSVLAPSMTPGPLGPWGAGPPPWAQPGQTPPWGYSGPPPWATGGPPIFKGKGKGKRFPPGRPVAAVPED